MSYCPECGTEVTEEAQFCSDCGATLQTSSEKSANHSIENTKNNTSVSENDEGGIETVRAAASGAMGIIVGAIVAFAFTNFGGSSILFLITLVGVAYYLYSKQETIKLTIGMGLYIAALWMPLAPIIFYIPLAGSANSETAAGAGQAIGSVLGMFLYGFIGLIIGIVLAAIGYFVRKGERE